jgi:hypothetical protein
MFAGKMIIMALYGISLEGGRFMEDEANRYANM